MMALLKDVLDLVVALGLLAVAVVVLWGLICLAGRSSEGWR